MTQHKLWATLLSLSLGLGSLTGCSQLARLGIGVTTIGTVTASPTQYKEVTVRGKVVNQFSLLGQGAYQLQDDTGSLWVFTQAGMPALNSTLTVRGQAAEGLNIGGQNFGVTLSEKERL